MNHDPAIAVRVADLRKSFSVPERDPGLWAAARSLVRRKSREVRAVDGVTFDVAAGEVVGFLGPNGAGKTTTLKMLAGLLHPSAGAASVLGHVPWRRAGDYLRRMSLIMGQRNQLVWDIPALDSFDLQRAIYQIPADEFRRARDELIDLLDLGPVVRKPVRNLSLGERMKAEIAAALLHQPQVLFLDEPTIGLDVTMQRRIRAFLTAYNQRHGATVMLTSHYMADVQALCRRVIVIHLGRLLYDGDLAGLAARFSAYKTIEVTLENGAVDWKAYAEVVAQRNGRVTLRVPRAETSRVAAQLLADFPAAELVIEEPPIEEVIERVFAQEAAPAGPAPAGAAV
jgi:ABC-2 type transport system ATP-binding protein